MQHNRNEFACFYFFFQAEDGIRDGHVTGVQTCALPIYRDGDEQALMIAEQSLDGMLAGELYDRVDGGFFRYALAADWTEPRREKLLAVNAELLRAYALGAHLLDRADLRAVVAEVVDWVDESLRLEDGLWGGSQAASEEYYALEESVRRGAERPPVDQVVYTDANAMWIRA